MREYTIDWSVLDVKATSPDKAAVAGIQKLIDGAAPLVDVCDEEGELITQVEIVIENGKARIK